MEKLFYQINHLASEYYHFLLLKHRVGKKALDYILGRGINRELLDQFKIGYSPMMWDGLQKFLVGKKKYKPTDLAEAGLIIKSQRGFYDRFRGRLMFPLRDHQGNIRGFAGRVLEKNVKEAATRLSQLINKPTLRKKMGKAGRKHVQENFDINIIAEKLYQTYTI